MNRAREFDQSVLADLRALLGDRVSTSAAVREHHGKDESYFPYALPDAVVFAHSTEEVRDIVNICRRHHVPMIPFGVGTSLEGHVLAIAGGVSIDLSQMNNVLAVHEEDLDAVVQAGVTRKQLNEYIKHTGLFFAIDPGADATLGGMAATRASGTHARHHHRSHCAPIPGAGVDVGRRLRLPFDRWRREDRDPEATDGHSDCA